jgi:hypothetical protein
VSGECGEELAEEVEVDFGGDLFVDAFVDVVVLVAGFALPPFEVFVELVAVLEQQIEYLLRGVVDYGYLGVSLGHGVGEGCWADEHALEDVDHFDFELWVGYLLVDGHEDVEDVGLVFGVGDRVEFGCQDAQ